MYEAEFASYKFKTGTRRSSFVTFHFVLGAQYPLTKLRVRKKKRSKCVVIVFLYSLAVTVSMIIITYNYNRLEAY